MMPIEENDVMYIPSIPENKVFCSKKDAEKVALMVIKKLNKLENPSIKTEELKQLNISLDCN